MTEEHAHRWLIPPPSGRYSEGVCRLCGESKTFFNTFDVDYGKPTRNISITPSQKGTFVYDKSGPI